MHNFFTLDKINAFFPLIGCFFVILNIKKMMKDKELKGSQWFSPLFFYTGQGINVYLLLTLKQWFSFVTGAMLLCCSLTWWSLMMYYKIRNKKET